MTILISVAALVGLLVWWHFWLRYEPWLRRHGIPASWKDAAYVVYVKSKFRGDPLMLSALVRIYAEESGYGDPRSFAYPKPLLKKWREQSSECRWPSSQAKVLQRILRKNEGVTGVELAMLGLALDQSGIPYSAAPQYVKLLGVENATDAIRHGIPVEYAAAL